MKSPVPIIPAKNPCIKTLGLCELREFEDSKFECIYSDKYCPWREQIHEHQLNIGEQNEKQL